MKVGRTVGQLADQIAQRVISPVEATRHFLTRAHALNKLYNALIAITDDYALDEARLSRLRRAPGTPVALAGVPITLKDVVAVRGLRTTNGSVIDLTNVSKRTAVCAANLQRAGTVLIGKANLDEYCLGATSENPHFGPVHNPWDVRLGAGGSSGGSAAAVAARIGLGSLGTDTGGSVRIPAAMCGVFGLKPTFGQVSTRGVTATSWSLDHVGVMASRVEDVAILYAGALGVLTNSSPKDWQVRSTPLRIGVPLNYFTERIDRDVATHYRRALKNLERAGFELTGVTTPVSEGILEVGMTLAWAEARMFHQKRIASNFSAYGARARSFLERAASVTLEVYLRAARRQIDFRNSWEPIFKRIDVLATPTTPITPKPIGQAVVRLHGSDEPLPESLTRFTSPFNVSGHPAMTIPCGLTSAGLPVGLQLVAPHRREDWLFSVAYRYQDAFLASYLRRLDELGD